MKREIRFPNGLEPPRQEWFLAGSEPPRAVLTLKREAARITYPPSGAIMATDPDIPAQLQEVLFLSEGFQDGISWWLNGEPLSSTARSLPWALREGNHLLALVDREGKTLDQVSFQVKGPTTWKELRSHLGEDLQPSPAHP